VADHYDVIIAGTGAGGGTLANVLAPSGKRILLLERGERGRVPGRGADADQAGAVNPALAVMANAIRVGEHLLERMA
jgi:2-polyprenyl-6-methoxyphenol hydroxylase-like FAD-dependent oxidoreductase